MTDFIFTSVAFGPQYVEQQIRLKKSILQIYPDADILFWTNELPKGSKPFLDSLYGFKPHAVAEAMKTHKRVIWLDPAMILTDHVTKLFNYPVVAVKDDSVLWNVTSNKTYQHYGIRKEEVMAHGWHLVGGSLYSFDFTQQEAVNVFNLWYNAEIKGLFGSQQESASEQLQGHRYDETLMAYAMYFNNIEPQRADEVGYCISEKSIFQKKHFK